MPLIVQKYGGSSLDSPDRVRDVAERVGKARAHADVLVVVSAMGSETDDLVELAETVSATHPPREMDMLLTAGERKSTALLSMALSDIGVAAESLTGDQAGVTTNASHQRAEILNVDADRVRNCLAAGIVPVVAGFQGLTPKSEITTLGRGGSDTTAVALAAALGADECEICTDVRGVFTADPRFVDDARLLPQLSYEELLELTAAGCPKPDARAVELARRYHVPLQVRSSFTDEPGTRVVQTVGARGRPAVALAHDCSVAKITLRDVPHRPGTAASLFRLLADANVVVDMIVQNASRTEGADISFNVSSRDARAAFEVCQRSSQRLEVAEVRADAGVATVSVVGSGMRDRSGVAAKMFEVLAGHAVNIEMISTGAIRISCSLREQDVQLALRSLHDAFALGRESVADDRRATIEEPAVLG